MSHQGKQDNIPQKQIGSELHKFFDHVLSHDEEGIHGAICMVANAVPGEESDLVRTMHVCNFGAGDPDVLAHMLVTMIDNMREKIPGFDKAMTTALRARAVKEMISTVTEALKERAEELKEEAIERGMNSLDVERAAKEALAKVMSSPGAMPGNETKH